MPSGFASRGGTYSPVRGVAGVVRGSARATSAAGDWAGIRFEGLRPDSRLESVWVRYVGGACQCSAYGCKLLASKTPVAPGQTALLKFKPSIFISVASQIKQGQVLDSAIISDVNAQLSLLGIQSPAAGQPG